MKIQWSVIENNTQNFLALVEALGVVATPIGSEEGYVMFEVSGDDEKVMEFLDVASRSAKQARKQSMTTVDINKVFGLSANQIRAQEAPAAPAPEQPDEKAIVAQEVQALFENTYDQEGPDGLVKLCYSAVSPEVQAEMKALLEQDVENTIKAMVDSLVADAGAVKAWSEYAAAGVDEEAVESPEHEMSETSEEEEAEHEPKFEAGDAIEEISPYGVKSATLIGGIHDGHYLVGYELKPVPFKTLEATHKRVGEMVEKKAEKKVAIDSLASNYWNQYFHAYGAMMVRPAAFVRRIAKTAQEEVSGWEEFDNGQLHGLCKHKGPITFYAAEHEDGYFYGIVVYGDMSNESGKLSSLEEAKSWCEQQDSKQASTKVAADAAAKKYWTDYFMAYGAKLVQDGLVLRKYAQVKEKLNEWVQIAPNVLEVDYADGAHGAIVECEGKVLGTLICADGTVHEIPDAKPENVDALHATQSLPPAHAMANEAGKIATKLLKKAQEEPKVDVSKLSKEEIKKLISEGKLKLEDVDYEEDVEEDEAY